MNAVLSCPLLGCLGRTGGTRGQYMLAMKARLLLSLSGLGHESLPFLALNLPHTLRLQERPR